MAIGVYLVVTVLTQDGIHVIPLFPADVTSKYLNADILQRVLGIVPIHVWYIMCDYYYIYIISTRTVYIYILKHTYVNVPVNRFELTYNTCNELAVPKLDGITPI